MRGVNREEKEIAIKKLIAGVRPAQVAKDFELPYSTVLTWAVEAKKRRKVTISESEVKGIIKNSSTLISVAEARILAAASKVVNPNISDDKWFEFNAIVTKELQNLIVLRG